MSLVEHHGDPFNPIWVIISEPYDKDQELNRLFSCGYGYNFKKIWKMGGLSDCYIRSVRPCIGATYDKPASLSNLLSDIEYHTPKIIVPLSDEVLNFLVPETRQQKEKNSSLRKWAGSLLQSNYLKYSHYIIGSFDPEFVTRNWDQHEIQAFIHFGHVREEFEFIQKNGYLNPLPQRTLIVNPTYDILIDYLELCLTQKRLSVDIETIRPRKNTFYWEIKHPGYPYLMGIAISPHNAISFNIWEYPPDQTVKVWRLMDRIFNEVPLIGQNFFVFDSHFKEALGLRVNLKQTQDTLIRHHILWPSLPHKLQFQTIQYTRQPYYKDEAAGFNYQKYKEKIMRYNALDCCITFEIYNEQEKEFQERPHLI